MRRSVVLGVLLSVGALSLGGAESQQQDEMVVEVEQLEDNLFVLRGGGGNSAAFVTSDGVVLVDTKVPGWGQPLTDKIAELTPNPVTMIINTHTHFDHVSGNVEFPATVDIVAHENTQRLMGVERDQRVRDRRRGRVRGQQRAGDRHPHVRRPHDAWQRS